MTGRLGEKGAVACFGCDADLPDEVGRYYCDDCIAKQAEEYGDELAAYDDFHRFADECARRSR